MREMKSNIDLIVNESNAKIALGNEMREDQSRITGLIRNYVIYADKEESRQIIKEITSARKNYSEAYEKMGPLLRTENGKQIYADIKEQGIRIDFLLDKVILLIDAGETAEGTEFLLKETVEPQDKWFGLLKSLMDLQTIAIHVAVEKMKSNYVFTVNFLWCAVLLAIAAGIWLAYWIGRSITHSIQQAVKVAQTVASGDFTSQIEVTSTDEAGQLQSGDAVPLAAAVRMASPQKHVFNSPLEHASTGTRNLAEKSK